MGHERRRTVQKKKFLGLARLRQAVGLSGAFALWQSFCLSVMRGAFLAWFLMMTNFKNESSHIMMIIIR
jgi:hypothetical protein